MFGIYLNGYWDRDGYHGVDAGDDSFVPRLVGLFPFGEEAQAFANILEQDATIDWKGDYEVSLYRPDCGWLRREMKFEAKGSAGLVDTEARSILDFDEGRLDNCEFGLHASSARNRAG